MVAVSHHGPTCQHGPHFGNALTQGRLPNVKTMTKYLRSDLFLIFALCLDVLDHA